MSGLLRRIRRPGAAEETRTEAIAPPDPAHGSAPETAPVPADGSRLPAGVGPEDLERRKGAGRRGKVRRRARFLRRARELALRDLGGLVYEAHRRGQDGAKLVKEKVQHLGVIDAELHALEAELGTPRGETVLREPGVGGTCPRCGELHASDAHFCSRCGLDLTAVPAPEQAAAAAPLPAEPVANEAAAPGDAAAEAAPGESHPAQTEAAEAAPAEQPRREPKRWWRRRSQAASEVTAAEPATTEATTAEAGTSEAPAAGPETTEAPAADAAEPETSEAPAADAAEPETSEAPAANAAEPETTEAPAAEQPTTDLATDSSQAANGRAIKTNAPDPERSA